MRRGLAELFLGALFWAGCSSPCRDLAERICSCEPNRTEEQACTLRLDGQSTRNVTAADEERCATFLEVCDCPALDRGDLAACGLVQTGE